LWLASPERRSTRAGECRFFRSFSDAPPLSGSPGIDKRNPKLEEEDWGQE
jgi:hypothetical protein